MLIPDIELKNTYAHTATNASWIYKNFLSFEQIELKLKIMVHANVKVMTAKHNVK